MRDRNRDNDQRGNLERLGESAGAMAGRAADFGMEVTGSLFRSAAEMLGGWWSSEAPRQAVDTWTDTAERDCRSHYQATTTAGGRARSAGTGSPGVESAEGVGGTQATHSAAPKSAHASMQADTGLGSVGTAGEFSGSARDTGGLSGSAQIGDTRVSGSARFDSKPDSASDSAADGFERARPGYQLGYVARQNPAYRNRSFSDVEPELKRVWESRAKTESGGSESTSSWPEVRGFVDFAYQHGDERR